MPQKEYSSKMSFEKFLGPIADIPYNRIPYYLKMD